MEVSYALSVIGNAVIGYFGHLYLRKEKNKVGKEGVFTNFSWKRGVFSYFSGFQESLLPSYFRHSHRMALSLSCSI